MTGTVVTIFIPTFAVLIGILINRSDATSLRPELASLRVELHGQIGGVRGEISGLRGEITSVRAEISSVRAEMTAMRAQFHGDVVQLMNVGREQESRIARLEERP